MNARSLAPLAGAVLVSTAWLVAQTTVPPLPPPQLPKLPEVTATGCLIQGSTPAVFLLDNARLATEDPSQPGKTYVMVAANEDMDFRGHLNNQVTVVGMSDDRIAPVPPLGEKVPERDLPRFTAKTVAMIAEKCTPAGR